MEFAQPVQRWAELDREEHDDNSTIETTSNATGAIRNAS